jgi:hypothetical protein
MKIEGYWPNKRTMIREIKLCILTATVSIILLAVTWLLPKWCAFSVCCAISLTVAYLNFSHAFHGVLAYRDMCRRDREDEAYRACSEVHDS